MTIEQVEIQLIASVVAAACALPGVFLILRRTAMMSDAISHTVLLGIVGGFLIVGTLDHPLLIIGAAVVGVLTVSLVELLSNTKLVKEDAAIGLVFPALFSIGVLLVSLHLGDQHFHADCIVDGNIQAASAYRLRVGDVVLGPKVLYAGLVALALLLAFIVTFFKELKVMAFDPGLAALMGFRPRTLHLVWLVLVSLTLVVAFQVAGPVLAVALMITPPAAASLLTDRLDRMFVFSALIALAACIPGFFLAWELGVPAGGPIASMVGAIFLLVFLFAPKHGLVARVLHQKEQRWRLYEQLLLLELSRGEEADPTSQKTLDSIRASFPDSAHFDEVLRRAEVSGCVTRRGSLLSATARGLERLPN